MARLISDIENGRPHAQAAVRRLYPGGGRAHVVGVTGPPGCGKSSLVNEMARAWRSRAGAPDLAIIAVDPTSPFSGGAILGDRIRMRDLHGDPGVFIRSMASRGALGGRAGATADVAAVLDACGYGVILIETVGAGQLDVEVSRVAHTVVLVEAPGLGDDVQAAKAGILEIADVVAINKADLGGADAAARALQAALDLAAPEALAEAAEAAEAGAGRLAWRVPIVQASAVTREGVAELIARIEQHGAYLRASGEGARLLERALERDIQARLGQLLLRRALQQLPPDRLRQLARSAAQRSLHPAEAAEQLAELLGSRAR